LHLYTHIKRPQRVGRQLNKNRRYRRWFISIFMLHQMLVLTARCHIDKKLW